LNNTAQGASQYRASEKQDFAGASWQTYNSAPTFNLSVGNGTKRVYFQVKNAMNQPSNSISDTITLNVPAPPAPTTKQFKIQAGTAYGVAHSRGFYFGQTGDMSPGECKMIHMIGYGIKNIAEGTPVSGKRCDFVLFGGRQLNEGWKFIDYGSYSESCYDDSGTGKEGYTINQRPQAGSRNIEFRVHVWTGLGTLNSPINICEWYLESLTLEGPATSASWEDAFK